MHSQCLTETLTNDRAIGSRAGAHRVDQDGWPGPGIRYLRLSTIRGFSRKFGCCKTEQRLGT
jgi:hypothetical protein